MATSCRCHHRETRVGLDRASVDVLLPDHRERGEEVVHVGRGPQHQDVRCLELRQVAFEPVEPSRWPGYVGAIGSDGTQSDDMGHSRRSECVADRPTHHETVLHERRIGDVLGQHHERCDGAVEQRHELVNVHRIALDDLRSGFSESRQVPSMLECSDILTCLSQQVGDLAPDVAGCTHHRDHYAAPPSFPSESASTVTGTGARGQSGSLAGSETHPERDGHGDLTCGLIALDRKLPRPCLCPPHRGPHARVVQRSRSARRVALGRATMADVQPPTGRITHVTRGYVGELCDGTRRR